MQPPRLCCLAARSGCCRAALLPPPARQRCRRSSQDAAWRRLSCLPGPAEEGAVGHDRTHQDEGHGVGRQCPLSPGCGPSVSALLGRVRGTEPSCRSPSEQGPPDTAMARSRASISGSQSTGCRHAESLGGGGRQQPAQAA